MSIQKKYPWPVNLIYAVFGPQHFEENGNALPADPEASVEYVLNNTELEDKYVKVLLMRYKERLTLQEAGDAFNANREWARRTEAKALRLVRHPRRLRVLRYGLTVYLSRKAEDEKNAQAQFESYKDKIQEAVEKYKNTGNPDELSNISLDDLGLSVRTFNALFRSGIRNLRAIISRRKSELIKVRNLGVVSVGEISKRLSGIGLALREE